MQAQLIHTSNARHRYVWHRIALLAALLSALRWHTANAVLVGDAQLEFEAWLQQRQHLASTEGTSTSNVLVSCSSTMLFEHLHSTEVLCSFVHSFVQHRGGNQTALLLFADLDSTASVIEHCITPHNDCCGAGVFVVHKQPQLSSSPLQALRWTARLMTTYLRHFSSIAYTSPLNVLLKSPFAFGQTKILNFPAVEDNDSTIHKLEASFFVISALSQLEDTLPHAVDLNQLVQLLSTTYAEPEPALFWDQLGRLGLNSDHLPPGHVVAVYRRSYPLSSMPTLSAWKMEAAELNFLFPPIQQRLDEKLLSFRWHPLPQECDLEALQNSLNDVLMLSFMLGRTFVSPLISAEHSNLPNLLLTDVFDAKRLIENTNIEPRTVLYSRNERRNSRQNTLQVVQIGKVDRTSKSAPKRISWQPEDGQHFSQNEIAAWRESVASKPFLDFQGLGNKMASFESSFNEMVRQEKLRGSTWQFSQSIQVATQRILDILSLSQSSFTCFIGSKKSPYRQHLFEWIRKEVPSDEAIYAISDQSTTSLTKHISHKLFSASDLIKSVLAPSSSRYNHTLWKQAVHTSVCLKAQKAFADTSGGKTSLARFLCHRRLLEWKHCQQTSESDPIECPLRSSPESIHSSMIQPLRQLVALTQNDGALGLAERCLQLLTSVASPAEDDWALLCQTYADSRRYRDARRCFESALSKYPKSYAMLVNFGSMLRRHFKEAPTAKKLFKRAVKSNPKGAEGWYNLGSVLQHEDRKYGAARRAYERALDANPGLTEATQAIASIFSDQGDHLESLHYHELAAAASPHSAATINSLGVAYKRMNRLPEAAQQFQRAVDLDHSNVDALTNLGSTQLEMYRQSVGHRQLGKEKIDFEVVKTAMDLFHRSVDLDPTYAHAHANIADLHQELGLLTEAIPAYERALQADSSFSPAFCNMMRAKVRACNWNHYNENMAELAKIIPSSVNGSERHVCVHALHALAYPLPDHLILGLANRTSSDAFASANIFVHENRLGDLGIPGHLERTSSYVYRKFSHRKSAFDGRIRRLRVGYLSSDMGDHPVGRRMQHFFAFCNHSRVESIVLALSPHDGSNERNQIEADADETVLLTGLSDQDIVKSIADRRLDVLLNLNGYTAGGRSDLLSIVLAPVQALYLGYAETLASAAVPFILTDRIATPPELARPPILTERVAYFPHTHFFSAYGFQVSAPFKTKISEQTFLERMPLSRRPELGLPRDKVVLCSFSQMYKITPSMFSVWASILKRSPNAVLWLQETVSTAERTGASANLRAELRRLGVPPNRLIITEAQPLELHLNAKSMADLFLDTMPYNSHSTAADALWSGIPVLTLQGDRMVSRVASSLLHALKMPELVTFSLAEYEEVAVELCRQPSLISRLRHKLQVHLRQSAAFVPAKFAEGYERVVLGLSELSQRHLFYHVLVPPSAAARSHTTTAPQQNVKSDMDTEAVAEARAWMRKNPDKAGAIVTVLREMYPEALSKGCLEN